MNKLLSKLPLLAFVLAATFAFGFNAPEKENTSKYGSHEGEVYDVTNVNVGPEEDEYQCNSLSGQCLYEDEAMNNPISGSWGEFAPGDELIPVD